MEEGSGWGTLRRREWGNFAVVAAEIPQRTGQEEWMETGVNRK